MNNTKHHNVIMLVLNNDICWQYLYVGNIYMYISQTLINVLRTTYFNMYICNTNA